ncbi:cation transporting atpase [Holotrichia oblita]|nr:cation transporting atpase [Holotrichia oblita]
MEAHKLNVEQTIAAANSHAELGLTQQGVKKSLETHGANVLSKGKKKSLLRRIWEGLTEPMMIILLIAFGITVAVNIINVTRGASFDYIESLGILVALALSVTITLVMEGRSAKAFETLNKMGDNILIKVIRNGIITEIYQEDLVVGDIIELEVGDKIPVDCRLISTVDFQVDESPLTGESAPVKKDSGKLFGEENVPLAERINMIYGGCYVTNGSARAVVVKVGDSTEIGSIAKELSNSEQGLTPLQHKLDKLGKIIAVLGGIAAALVFVVQLITLIVSSSVSFDSVQNIFVTSIVLIVASVPEGLPTIVAVSLALNVIKMAKQNALVKKMVACETVGSISVICSDKTGTLTENKMTVTSIATTKGSIEPGNLTDEFIRKNFCINTTANILCSKIKPINLLAARPNALCLSPIRKLIRAYLSAVISDPIRKEVYAAVEECRRAGVQIKMLTGDNIITAKAIANELKIITNETEVFHANQIEKMSDDELRKCIDKIKLTVNLSAVIVTVVCILLGMEAPFNALELLWINLIMDGPPALTLGLEPISDDLMNHKPTDRNASIVTQNMLIRIVINGLFISAVMISQAMFNFLGIRADKEKTIIFTLFVMFQLFNAFNSREIGENSAFKTLYKNKIMIIVMIITFTLQIIITQFGTAVFSTIPLTFKEWLVVVCAAFSIIVFNELYKFIMRLPFRQKQLQSPAL